MVPQLREDRPLPFSMAILRLRFSPNAGAISPFGADEGGAREMRNAVFVIVNLADDHIDGGLAGHVVALMHACYFRLSGSPLELDYADVFRDGKIEFFEPVN